MGKVALFVEGLTELVFAREFLIKWHEYDVAVRCYNLFAESYTAEDYQYGEEGNPKFYQIVNVGNDRLVLTKMLKNAERLKSQGFDLVAGLRDMYCEDYHEFTQNINNARIIDLNINEQFRKGAYDTILNAAKPVDIRMYFAIMEIETWLLGMPQFLKRLSRSLTDDTIKGLIDLNEDPENTIYHPAKLLCDILNCGNMSYGKHKHDIEAIMSVLEKSDFEQLLNSGKCRSFADFVDGVVERK